MTDWRICGGIQRIDICYGKRSRTSCSKLATRTCFDFDLIVPLWKSASFFTNKLMGSKYAGPTELGLTILGQTKLIQNLILLVHNKSMKRVVKKLL